MAKYLTFLILIWISFFNTNAQNSYRLINHKQFQYSTSSSVPIDSNVYFWSGGRGKNFRTTEQFFADSIQYFTLNYTSGLQNLSFSYHNSFNPFNKTLNHVRRAKLDGTLFGVQFKVNFTYDGAGNEIHRVHLFYNNSNFSIFDTLAVYVKEYNAKNQLTKEIYRVGNSGVVSNQTLKTYAYDANGNTTDYLEQKWETGSWSNYSRDTYTYNAKNKVSTRLNERWSSGKWVIINKYSYSYNGAGYETQLLLEGWDGSNWFNNMRIVSEWDGNNLLVQRTQETFGLSKKWIPSNKHIYQNDAAGNRTKDWSLKFVITVSPDSGEFAYDYEYSYLFDANNNNTVLYYTELSGFVPTIAFRDTATRYEFAYEEYVSTNQIQTFKGVPSVVAFPNPASDILSIQIPDVNFFATSIISVYDLKGAVIKSVISSQSKVEMNIEEIPSGIYFLGIQSGGKAYYSRFVKD